MDLLQNAILEFYAHNLIEKEDLNQIKVLFESFDKNGDGLLSFEEIESVMESQGRKEDSKEIFKILDYENTKSISYKEFIKSLIDRKRLQNEDNIKRCFEAIDVEKDGKILIDEIRKISFITTDSKDNAQFKLDFYRYSQGKHYVNFISFLMKISLLWLDQFVMHNSWNFS